MAQRAGRSQPARLLDNGDDRGSLRWTQTNCGFVKVGSSSGCGEDPASKATGCCERRERKAIESQAAAAESETAVCLTDQGRVGSLVHIRDIQNTRVIAILTVSWRNFKSFSVDPMFPPFSLIEI